MRKKLKTVVLILNLTIFCVLLTKVNEQFILISQLRGGSFDILIRNCWYLVYVLSVLFIYSMCSNNFLRTISALIYGLFCIYIFINLYLIIMYFYAESSYLFRCNHFVMRKMYSEEQLMSYAQKAFIEHGFMPEDNELWRKNFKFILYETKTYEGIDHLIGRFHEWDQKKEILEINNTNNMYFAIGAFGTGVITYFFLSGHFNSIINPIFDFLISLSDTTPLPLKDVTLNILPSSRSPNSPIKSLVDNAIQMTCPSVRNANIMANSIPNLYQSFISEIIKPGGCAIETVKILLDQRQTFEKQRTIPAVANIANPVELSHTLHLNQVGLTKEYYLNALWHLKKCHSPEMRANLYTDSGIQFNTLLNTTNYNAFVDNFLTEESKNWINSIPATDLTPAVREFCRTMLFSDRASLQYTPSMINFFFYIKTLYELQNNPASIVQAGSIQTIHNLISVYEELSILEIYKVVRDIPGTWEEVQKGIDYTPIPNPFFNWSLF
jgi:hypothetical protein